MRCLDDPTILRFVMGRLDEREHRRVEKEVGRCGRCAALVAELMRDRSASGTPPGSTVDARVKPAPHAETASADEDAEAGDLEALLAEIRKDGVLSRYVLGARIARGGMGTIVAAFDRQLSRPVAIKVLNSDRAELGVRFAREIRVTASLQHPGIVPIYDCGHLPDGRPFFAMRHVPGASLEEEIARRQSDRERMALLVPALAAAEAVAYAHERGVVHRDLKPSNILVGPFGETVVIDWGLARFGDASVPDPIDLPIDGDPMMTVRGAVLGTPRYMSPEQARGEPASFPSDVYALGAILYHSLAGSPPVAASEVRAVLEQVARSEVVPLARVVPGLPGDLAAIVERAMAARPEERYATAGDLAADLRRFQTGQLVAAHSYSRRDLASRFVRRHRAALTLAGLCGLVVAVVAMISVRRIVGEREEAQAQRRIAERERAGAEDLVYFLLYDLRAKLKTVGRLDVLSGVADRVESYYLNAAAERAELPESLRARAELDGLRADVANNAGDGVAADEHLRRGMAFIERVPAAPRSDEVRAGLLASAALRAGRQGELARSRALFLEAASVRRGIQPTDAGQRRRNDVELASVMGRAAVLGERMGQAGDAEREWAEAAALLGTYRARDPDDLDAAVRLGEIQMAMGQSSFRRGKFDAAERSLELALAAGSALAAHEPKNVQYQNLLIWSCLSLSDVAQARGQLAAGRALSERALASARLVTSIEPASAVGQRALVRAEMNLGDIALGRSEWAAAAQHLGSAREAIEQLVARDPSNREDRRAAAVSTAQLARAQTRLGATDVARATWQASLLHLANLAEPGVPKARMEWANGLRLYAAFERGANQPDAADQAIEKAMSLLEATPAMVERPSDLCYRAGVFLEAGRAHAARGRHREARRAWERGAALLHELATEMPLEAEAAEILRDIEAELAGSTARTAAR